MVVLPIRIVAPSASVAFSTRLPLTNIPFVEPRSCTRDAWFPVDVLGLVDADLDVLSGDAGVIDPQVGVVATPDHDAGRRQGQVLPVELRVAVARRTWVSEGSPPARLAFETALLRTRKRPVVRSSVGSSTMLTGPVNT